MDSVNTASAVEFPAVTSDTADAVRVLDVRHWTDRLFSFSVERPASFRFRSGEFVMIGLLNEAARPLVRAYSIASPFWDETLSFYSIKVENGPLTSRLQHITAGDYIIMRTKPVGTLVLDALLPGERLYLISTGTGVAPFASLLRDPELYGQFDNVILTHTCREVDELAFSADLVQRAKIDPLVGESAKKKLIYFPTTTREPSNRMGRVTNLIESGNLFDDLNLPGFQPETDRVMICGSMNMNKDMKDLCLSAGLSEGANSEPGQFVVEKAFVG